MLNRFFNAKLHDHLQLLGVFVLVVGLPLSKVLMSIGTILLAANLLLKADFKGYWEKWKKNIVFWFVLIVLILHVFGLLYTSDLDYAFRDLKTKLPFFVIPIVMIAIPIEKRFLKYILYGFLITLLITSIINFSFMMKNDTWDYRDFSLFGSHIRYSLLIVTGILLSIYLLLKNKKFWVLYNSLIAWLVYYTLISQVFSGYVALAFLMLGCFIYFIKRVKKKRVKKLIIVFALGITGVSSIQLYQYLTPDDKMLDFQSLPTHSKYGEEYFHDTTSLWFENGNHILSCIAPKELEAAWNERAEIKYNGKTEGGYELKGILYRYMSSKGLTKDKEGMEAMSDQDIKNVRNEMTSIRYTYGTLRIRLAGLKNEFYHYSVGGDPDGNSLLQRFEHWKAGKTIIKQNWLIGVGTGDLQEEFNQAYAASNTQLDEVNWNRAHNQFMTFWISFGVFGFAAFLGFWLWFLWKNIKLNNLIGIGFALIAIGSFLSEDTIETQQGITFIALFLGITTLMNSWKVEGEIDKRAVN